MTREEIVATYPRKGFTEAEMEAIDTGGAL